MPGVFRSAYIPRPINKSAAKGMCGTVTARYNSDDPNLPVSLRDGYHPMPMSEAKKLSARLRECGITIISSLYILRERHLLTMRTAPKFYMYSVGEGVFSIGVALCDRQMSFSQFASRYGFTVCGDSGTKEEVLKKMKCLKRMNSLPYPVRMNKVELKVLRREWAKERRRLRLITHVSD